MITPPPFVAATILAILPSALAAQRHPLEPLSRRELQQGLTILEREGAIGARGSIAQLGLAPPPKAAVLAGGTMARRAAAVTYDHSTNATTELMLDLDRDAIVERRVVPAVSPLFLPSDEARLAEILKADSRWRALVRGRGLDPDSAAGGGYPIGAFGPSTSTDRFVISRTRGVIAYVNLTKKEIYRLVDAGGPGPADVRAPDRWQGFVDQPSSPLVTTLKDRPGYVRDGYSVVWGDWSFRIGVSPKEGLVLYLVQFGPSGNRRPVLYQASLSELWVPYGDRGQRDFYLNAFDIGEVGIARYGQPEMGAADCPNHAEFIPIAFLSFAGQVVETERGFCLFERDAGAAWRHGTVGRRHHQLVLSSVFRIDNYDYGLNWIFNQDGTLEAEVLLTGIMNLRPTTHGHGARLVSDTSYSTLVAPNVEAMHHQHFFNFRLDLDVVDPARNSVVEMNTLAPPRGPSNPHGNAIQLRQTVLRRELAAQRDLNLASHRFWRVLSHQTKNDLGQPVSYALWPGENSIPYAQLGTRTRARAGFTDHHLWVTPYRADELSAAGDYVYQSRGGDGLPRWTKANRVVEDTDLVLWYTLGVTHIPRPEDWPVMPVHRAGFRLAPFGMTAGNPLAPATP